MLSKWVELNSCIAIPPKKQAHIFILMMKIIVMHIMMDIVAITWLKRRNGGSEISMMRLIRGTSMKDRIERSVIRERIGVDPIGNVVGSNRSALDMQRIALIAVCTWRSLHLSCCLGEHFI